MYLGRKRFQYLFQHIITNIRFGDININGMVRASHIIGLQTSQSDFLLSDIYFKLKNYMLLVSSFAYHLINFNVFWFRVSFAQEYHMLHV